MTKHNSSNAHHAAGGIMIPNAIPAASIEETAQILGIPTESALRLACEGRFGIVYTYNDDETGRREYLIMRDSVYQYKEQQAQ